MLTSPTTTRVLTHAYNFGAYSTIFIPVEHVSDPSPVVRQVSHTMSRVHLPKFQCPICIATKKCSKKEGASDTA